MVSKLYELSPDIEKYFTSKFRSLGVRAYSRKYGMHLIFQKNSKKRQNIWKFGQKFTKFKNVFKKGTLMRATITSMKWVCRICNGCCHSWNIQFPLFSCFFSFFLLVCQLYKSVNYHLISDISKNMELLYLRMCGSDFYRKVNVIP